MASFTKSAITLASRYHIPPGIDTSRDLPSSRRYDRLADVTWASSKSSRFQTIQNQNRSGNAVLHGVSYTPGFAADLRLIHYYFFFSLSLLPRFSIPIGLVHCRPRFSAATQLVPVLRPRNAPPSPPLQPTSSLTASLILVTAFLGLCGDHGSMDICNLAVDTCVNPQYIYVA
ncbi:hypothetical protein BJX68DRAFT_126614 [Aspergillus pseudodeflectus]|uniref:Hydrophobin n=1 Tax=Aspergillus pseudodeflectus TaxID=176178 RepID=A0ABR4K1R1_9EURO